MTNWLVAVPAAEFDAGRDRGFELAALRELRRAGRLHAGDRVVFFLTDAAAIGGVVRVEAAQGEGSISPTAVCEPGSYVPVARRARRSGR